MFEQHSILLSSVSALSLIADNHFINRQLPIQTRLKVCQKVSSLFKITNINILATKFIDYQSDILDLTESSDILASELEELTKKQGAQSFLTVERKEQSLQLEIVRKCDVWLSTVEEEVSTLSAKVLKECIRKNIPINSQLDEEVFTSFSVSFTFDELSEMKKE